jgi:hypothetical protein
MKKLTKTLTRVCVILLSLVLITSSVVSTTLAKYTVTKEGKTTAGLKKFGLEVNVTSSHDTTPEYSNKSGDSMTLTFNDLTLKPGDNYPEAIKLSVTGQPVVDARVTIDVTVTYNGKKFVINNSDFEWLGNTASKTCVPIQFTVKGNAATAAYNSLTEAAAATAIKNALDEKADYDIDSTSNAAYKEFLAKDYTSTKQVEEVVNFGFTWTKDDVGNTADDKLHNHQIGTWFANRSDNDDTKSTLTVTYKITVEQIVTNG